MHDVRDGTTDSASRQAQVRRLDGHEGFSVAVEARSEAGRGIRYASSTPSRMLDNT
jgi:hypothetical protein